MPGLGRRPFRKDQRDYALAGILRHVATPTINRKWPDNEVVWDQGETGHCVGMGCGQWGNTLPVDDHWKVTDGHKLYYEAVSIGGLPQTEDGAQVRWGLTALVKRGRVSSYHKASSFSEGLSWVRSPTGGPLIIGIDWYEGFDHPTVTGVVHPTGEVRGGHCLLWFGATASYDYLLNSWGPTWGNTGRCRCTHSELAWLIDKQAGEAWVAIEKPI